MLGVEFEKIKNVTLLIYNEGTFFSKKDLQLHSSFKWGYANFQPLEGLFLGSPVQNVWRKKIYLKGYGNEKEKYGKESGFVTRAQIRTTFLPL